MNLILGCSCNRARTPRWNLCALLSTALLLAPGLSASDYQVIISEIHYHPLGGEEAATLEYLELHNLGGEEVDLGGWSLSEGIDLAFASGTVIGGKDFLIVSPDPQRARAFYSLGPGRVIGPYTGRLDNDGEIVALANRRGEVISRVHYQDSGVWPSLADGLGPSLEFTAGDNQNDLAGRWAASRVLGGTPGTKNSQTREPPPPLEEQRSVVIASTDVWRTFKGRSAPSNPVTAWTGVSFNDASWESLPGAFGYGSGHGFTFTTELDDMRFSYTTCFIRRSFNLDAERHAALLAGEARILLSLSYDDAFVAYLNGVEVGRDNVGQPGTPVPFDGTAASSFSGSLEINLAPFLASLRTGTNVLALQGANNFILGQDFFIGAELTFEVISLPPPAPEDATVIRGVLNEMRPQQGGGSLAFVELYNPTAAPLDLSNCFLISTGGLSARLPSSTLLQPRSFRAFDENALGSDLPLLDQVVVLLKPDGATIVDALDVEPRGSANSFGLFPDGGGGSFVMTQPTPGAANVYSFSSPVLINEIHFHPPFVPPSGNCAARCSDALQWVELWNRSAAVVDLGGWRLSRGIDFSFQAGTTIAAGGALVVASSLAEFRAGHPEVQNVIGDWTGRLAHDTDTIHLQDPLGNRVDRVKYGDGGPLNDDSPDDGIDDRTFRASPWPSAADGSGRTLELQNPGLDNELGLAWRASLVAGGTPGTPNSVFTPAVSPVAGFVEHSPAVPRSSDVVAVTCRLSALATITSALVDWAVEGGASGTRTLRDDGLSSDGAAGDGVYGALLPAAADGAVVAFQIRVTDQAGRTALTPVQPEVPPYSGFEGAFFLYEVDDTPPPVNGSPVYRIVMRQADVNELRNRNVLSDVLLPATFIGGMEVRYLAGLRLRGESSRREPNLSFRVDLTPESTFEGLEHLNLNGSNGGNFSTSNANEIIAADLFRRAGAPYPQVFPVNLHFPGGIGRDFDPRYALKENLDAAFLERFFGGSDGGNLYRARNPTGPGGPSGDLLYLGEDPEAYRPLYEKRSNREEDDFTDIIELTRAFDRGLTPDNVFPDVIESLIDAREWAQFFALQALLVNADGGIWNNNGEDYFLYRVPDDSTRPDKGKWLLLPWDLEETFANSNERLFLPDVQAIVRFLTHPRFAALYHEEIDLLRQGAFSRFEMRQRYGFVASMYQESDVYNVVDPLDSFVARRIGYLDQNVAAGILVGTFSPPAVGQVIVAPGETWRFFRGRSEAPGGSGAWTLRNYLDTQAPWETGPTGIGYGDGDDATTLDDMQGAYTTVFARKDFQVPDPSRVSSLQLTMDYDDAFVCYLNGVEVARSDNAPGVQGEPVTFDQLAAGTHEAGAVESFDLPLAIGALVAGRNVLAIAGFNQTLDSTDLSLIPTLFMVTVDEQPVESGGCGDELFTTGSRITLTGVADPVEARSVTVHGVLAGASFITAGTGPFGLSWNADVLLEAGDNLVVVETHSDAAGASPPLETQSVLVHATTGFTLVSGVLAANTTWTRDGGPYRIVGAVEVSAAATLTIEPGTVILANGGSGLMVRGRLLAEGLPESPIRFSAFHCDQPWSGIVIADTGTQAGAPTHILRNAIFEHGTRFQNVRGLIAPANSKLLVDGCTLRAIGANGIDGTSASLEVRNSHFESVFEGVHCTSSSVTILDSTFRNIIGDSDAIDFDLNGSGRSVVARCLIEGSSDDGLDLASTSVDIEDNVFRGVGDKAISLEGNGPLGPPVIRRNLIDNCGTGIALKDGVTIMDGDHNTVTRCQEGIDLFAKDAGPEGGHGVFHSVIVWDNVLDVRLDAKSTVSFTFSDVGSDVGSDAGAGDPWPGEGNIAASPRFAGPASLNFSLAATSPCIGTGKDGSDMGAIPFTGMPPVIFLRGDSNQDSTVNLSDAVHTLNHLFLGGPSPSCLDILDSNDDGNLNITDGIFTLSFLFTGGSRIPPPYPMPGPDLTQDNLPCGL